jgi:hypothetical protein
LQAYPSISQSAEEQIFETTKQSKIIEKKSSSAAAL